MLVCPFKPLKHNKMEVLFYPILPDFRKRILGFARLPALQEQHVKQDEYEALVEGYWQEKTEVLGEKLVPAPLFLPQISQGLT